MALPTSLLVPDGGQACADIRWYCRDAKSCTERWTANLPRHPHIAPTSASLAASAMPAPAMPAPGFEPAPRAAERRPGPGPEPVPAELRGRPVREAWSIDPS
jgi:hypothetical protein